MKIDFIDIQSRCIGQAANVKFVLKKYIVLYQRQDQRPGYERQDETDKMWNKMANKINMKNF